jgi:hypothetical protein
VPEDEKTTIHSIGDLNFNSDLITKTVPLKLNVSSKLKIEEVIVKLGSRLAEKLYTGYFSGKGTVYIFLSDSVQLIPRNNLVQG